MDIDNNHPMRDFRKKVVPRLSSQGLAGITTQGSISEDGWQTAREDLNTSTSFQTKADAVVGDVLKDSPSISGGSDSHRLDAEVAGTIGYRLRSTSSFSEGLDSGRSEYLTLIKGWFGVNLGRFDTWPTLRVDIAIYEPGQCYRQRRLLTGSTISSSGTDIRRFFESKMGNRAVEYLEPLIVQVANGLSTISSNVCKILNSIRHRYQFNQTIRLVAASKQPFSMIANAFGIGKVVAGRESTSTAEGAAVKSRTPTESILTQSSSLSQAISAGESCLPPAVTGFERPADAGATTCEMATIPDTGKMLPLLNHDRLDDKPIVRLLR